MGQVGFLSELMGFIICCVGLAVLVFAFIGVHKVYSDHKESKRQREHGKELEEETKRNKWEHQERLRDRVFLLEEVIKRSGIECDMEKVGKVISEVDYDARYNAWNKCEGKWIVLSLSSMVGGLGTSDEAQADLDADFERYEEQRIQELREKLDRIIEKDR